MATEQTTTKYPDFTVKRLGASTLDSPLHRSDSGKGPNFQFVPDAARITVETDIDKLQSWFRQGQAPPSMELAGPREKIFFRPVALRAGIVTCGGVCPGLNDVISALVNTLTFLYGVDEIIGFRYGYYGLVQRHNCPHLRLKPENVAEISHDGGTFLGTSRGPQDTADMVDMLEQENVKMLFTIGGDGTQRGAVAINQEAERRRFPVAVVGVPKTIDNDIAWVERTFGFETAFSIADTILQSAHAEAHSAKNGVCLVKLMGRYSGYIAALGALASGEANYVLVPEVPFELEGPNGLLAHLGQRLEQRGHALIVVAEGAGQDLLSEKAQTMGRDASGNALLADIGLFLKERIEAFQKETGLDGPVRYIDPSYTIRSLPTVATDSVFCKQLAQNAVHAAMTGRTEMLVGIWNGQFVHVPIHAATSTRKTLDPHGDLWRSVLQSTGQPHEMTNRQALAPALPAG